MVRPLYFFKNYIINKIEMKTYSFSSRTQLRHSKFSFGDIGFLIIERSIRGVPGNFL